MKLGRGKSALISAAYRPPNRIDEQHTSSKALTNDITTARSDKQSAYFLLGGYFNLKEE